jgi:predicted outer membrane protein
MKVATDLRSRVAMVGALCAAVALAACRGGNAHETPVARPAAATRSDSSTGEVAQYSLMKDAVGWLTDSNLVALATIVNQAPERLARVESQQSTDQAVHQFALEVIRDHGAFQASLDSLAGRRRIPPQRPAVAESIQAPYDSAVTALSSTPTQQLEGQYLAAERALDTRTMLDFGALAGNATDPDLHSLLVSRAMAMEQRHLTRANQLAASLAQADSAKQAAHAGRKP